MTTAGQVQFK